MDEKKEEEEEKKKAFFFYWRREIIYQKVTNCLVAKMCINLSEIHISYSFSYTRI